MCLIIDRIVNGLAVCEGRNGGQVKLPLSALPEGAREGDVIREKTDGEGKPEFFYDGEATGRRRKEMQERLSRLTGKGNDDL